MEKELVSKGWRTATIWLIIVSAIMLLSLIGLFVAGNQLINNESNCAYNVCEDYDVYYYDVMEKMCYCFENNVIVKQNYMG